MEESPGRRRGRPKTWDWKKHTTLAFHPDLINLLGVIQIHYGLPSKSKVLEFLLKVAEFQVYDIGVVCVDLEDMALNRIMKYLDRPIYEYLLRRWIVVDPDTGRKKPIPELCSKIQYMEVVDIPIPETDKVSTIAVEKEVAKKFREFKQWNRYDNNTALKHLISVFYRLDLVKAELCSKMNEAQGSIPIWYKLLTKSYPDTSLVEFIKRYWLEETQQGLYRLKPQVCRDGDPAS